ncbi:unnamed protein product [Lymnaea stagnalis]|uniref:EF-hand domain-containing protein n=1 Tax=Lymnaea stagnalis TaxID=6523 RepID=A0AAV2ID45_LYMST
MCVFDDFGPATVCKMTSLLYALVLLLPGVTYGINLKPYNLTAAALFLNIDLDVSGDIDRPELDLNFKTYDTNNNGRVSRQEYTNYVNSHTPSLVPLHDAFYDIYDVDGDHQLDHHDFDNFFSLMDSTSDGIVSYFEFVRYWTILLETLEHLIVRSAAVKVTVQPTFQPNQQPLTTQKPLGTQQQQQPLTTQKPLATQQPLTTQKPLGTQQPQQPLTTQKPLATQQPQQPLTTQKPLATQQPQQPLTTQKPLATQQPQQPLTTQKPNA